MIRSVLFTALSILGFRKFVKSLYSLFTKDIELFFVLLEDSLVLLTLAFLAIKIGKKSIENIYRVQQEKE